jgi:uncharacterized protein
MTYLFELSHPKHYYQFRYIIKLLKSRGEKVSVLARKKDVLINLLDEESVPYIIPGKHGKRLLSKLFAIPGLWWNYLKIVRQISPDFIISKASPYAVLVKPFIKSKLVITPDSEVVNLTKKFVAPFSDIIITPESFNYSYGRNHKRIDGFFEETYLSPKAFSPDKELVKSLGIDTEKPYFILRFISWDANHDLHQFGFSEKEKSELISLLQPFGKVYISAERNKLSPSLQKYQLHIPASAIHHVLYYASLYIGDSQTMATEAALLGTPSIRYNSFVGENDMSNFKVLESRQLLMNFNKFSGVQNGILQILNNKESKQIWQQKRDDYFYGKPDLNEQILQYLGLQNKK